MATFCKVELDDSILCLNLRIFCINQAPRADRSSGPELPEEAPPKSDEFAGSETDLTDAIVGNKEELPELLEDIRLRLDEDVLDPIMDERTVL